MMRFAFFVVLGLLCLSAKASGVTEQASLDLNAPSAVEPAKTLKPSSDVQSNNDSTTPSFSEPNSSELAESSVGELVSKQSTLPLKKVSVSEASNWPFVLLTLLAMIICILLIAWIVKRFSGLTGLGGRDLKVVSAIAVGSRERVAVVEVKGEQFLIGATPHNISLLHHFSEEELLAANEKSALEQNKAPSAFADKLQSILKQSSVADSESK